MDCSFTIIRGLLDNVCSCFRDFAMDAKSILPKIRVARLTLSIYLYISTNSATDLRVRWSLFRSSSFET